MGLHQNEKLLHSKGNDYHNEETAYRMGTKYLLAHLTGDYNSEYIKNSKN
jgi:hypothetical protein